MEVLIDNYKFLEQGILRRNRIVREGVLLTSIDVKDFNHLTPIYISKYACMFYVNKIDNYVNKKFTKVELYTIRLLQ